MGSQRHFFSLSATIHPMHHKTSTRPVFAALAGLALASSSAHATVTITGAGSATEVNSATQTAYSGDVSTTDLLHGLTGANAVTSGWNGGAGSPAALNNGAHGGATDTSASSIAWTTVGATAEYNLGTGVSGLGYDITSIQSIAAWNSAGFANQAWTVEVKPVGGSYATLATVHYNPVAANGATKVTLTGLDPTGIEFIKFTANSVTGSSGNAFTFREIDVFGVESDPDVTAPLVSSLSPTDDLEDVPLASDLVVTFNEDVAIGSGNVILKNLDTSAETTIPVGDAQVAISGAVLTINPSSNLNPNTDYAVQIPNTAITDLSGNPFVGISGDTAWDFTTIDQPLRIMYLGDSITVGYTDNPGWNNHPFMFGYRSGLYTRLTNAGYNFQFVGGSTEPWTGISGDPTHGGTYTPAFDLRDFGQDNHRGYGGAGIWGNVNSWIDADNPDIILLLIGINGMGGGSQTALTNLVSSIVAHAPDVHLIVAQITPYSSFNQTLYDYNLYVRDTLVPGHVTAGNKVSTVDLYSFFLTDPSTYTTLPSTTGAVEPGVLSNNINHPDNPHYDLMAQEWYEGIQALGLGPDNFAAWIIDPIFDLAVADQDFDDDSDGDNLSNGLEAWFGTHPGQSNTGLANVSTVGNVTTFTHPQNPTVPDDLTGYYEWSPNLTDWYASGAGPGGGVTVTFSASIRGGTTTVTATVAGLAERIFLRAGVVRN